MGSPQDHDYFNDLALAVVRGPGQGAVYKITDYDYSAPHQWVPTQTYTSPDTWMDHVGDLAHGYWAAADRRRVFVDGEVSGVIGPGSVVSMTPAIYVTRGVNDTSATTHSTNTKMSIYRDLSVICDGFQFFSGEMDISLEEMVKEIAAKAGVRTVVSEKLLSGTVNLSHTGWDILADEAITGQARSGAIINFTSQAVRKSGGLLPEDQGELFDGDIITVSGSSISMIDRGSDDL